VTIVLRWSEPVLTLQAGDRTWVPHVELFNNSNATVEAGGARAAWGVLLRADGTNVVNKSSIRVPAGRKPYRLEAGESRAIQVVLGLTAEVIAALPPGRYRLAQVQWGELAAPDVDVEIRADQ
jgi:hypothetical protein